MSLLEGDLRTDDSALLRENFGLISDNGDLKGLAGCGAGAGSANGCKQH